MPGFASWVSARRVKVHLNTIKRNIPELFFSIVTVYLILLLLINSRTNIEEAIVY